MPCVYNDDRSAARELAQRMLACGHRRLVYIGGTEKDQAVGLVEGLFFFCKETVFVPKCT